MPLSRRACLALAALASTRPSRAQGFELREEAAGVHVHVPPIALTSAANGGDIANLGLIVGPEAAAVIDSGGSPRIGRSFLEAAGRITDRPIRYVVNTHMHPDHILGNAAFVAAGAIVVGHRNLPRAIAARREHYLLSYERQIGQEPMRGAELVAPSLLVADVLELDLGGRRLALKAWPAGHTDNDLTVLDLESATLFAGDLVFAGHVPVLDGRLLGWLQTLDALAAIPARHCVPGHGPSPQPWPEAAAAPRRYLSRLAEDVRGLIRRGATMGEAAREAARSERPHWLLFDDYNPRNATAAFAELEWE